MSLFDRYQWSFRTSVTASILSLLCLAVAVGLVRMTGTSSVATLGPFYISPFPSGLALYLDSDSWHYALSPLNDYVATADGSSTLLTSTQFSQDLYTSSYTQNSLLQRAQSISNFLTIQHPFFSLETAQLRVQYRTVIRDTQLRVQRVVRTHTGPELLSQGMTLKYQEGDFIYNPLTNSVYTAHTPGELEQYASVTGRKLYNSGSWQSELPTQLVLHNLAYPGMLVITALPGQQLQLDTANRLVSVHQSVQPPSDTAAMQLQMQYVRLTGGRDS